MQDVNCFETLEVSWKTHKLFKGLPADRGGVCGGSGAFEAAGRGSVQGG